MYDSCNAVIAVAVRVEGILIGGRCGAGIAAGTLAPRGRPTNSDSDRTTPTRSPLSTHSSPQTKARRRVVVVAQVSKPYRPDGEQEEAKVRWSKDEGQERRSHEPERRSDRHRRSSACRRSDAMRRHFSRQECASLLSPSTADPSADALDMQRRPTASSPRSTWTFTIASSRTS